jgi:hypothetical protein
MRLCRFLFLTMLSISVQAETKVLSCSTAGDAVDEVALIEGEQGNRIEVRDLNDGVTGYKVKRDFKHVKENDSDTLIGMGAQSITFGGAISDAVLMRVFKGGKEARLAVNGVVMFLKCKK